MMPIPEIVTIVALFILRFGVPLLLMIGIGYVLRRLDQKWEVELRAEREERQSQEDKSMQPGPALPFAPGYVPQAIMMDSYGKPCWDVKDCDQSMQEQCPAFQHADSPCWLARRHAEGEIPSMCLHCELFPNSYSEHELPPKPPATVYH